jgi:Zn-dependent alcohol dehydrogenase
MNTFNFGMFMPKNSEKTNKQLAMLQAFADMNKGTENDTLIKVYQGGKLFFKKFVSSDVQLSDIDTVAAYCELHGLELNIYRQ